IDGLPERLVAVARLRLLDQAGVHLRLIERAQHLAHRDAEDALGRRNTPTMPLELGPRPGVDEDRPILAEAVLRAVCHDRAIRADVGLAERGERHALHAAA